MEEQVWNAVAEPARWKIENPSLRLYDETVNNDFYAPLVSPQI